MSELKAGVLVTPHNEGMCFHRSSAVIAVTERETEFYLKSEADKVIAELIEKNERLSDDCLIKASNTFREIEKEIRHHKYKRCLAMAKLCKAKYDEEDASVNDGLSWYFISPKMKYWERWERRWLELAEKFKEVK